MTQQSITEPALRRAAELSIDFISSLSERRVGPSASLDDLRERLGGDLPDNGEDPAAVVDALERGVRDGLSASAGPRYFGFVIGGSLPAALAADWLTSAWDQNAGLYSISPAASVAEQVAGGWLVDLFGLPKNVSVGYTTGATMASFTGLAAGRHALLRVRDGTSNPGDCSARRNSRSSSARRPTLRFTRPCRCWVSVAIGSSVCQPTSRGACGQMRCEMRSPASTSQRSCVRSLATSTPARSTHCRTLCRRCAPTGAGCTWMGRSACGPRLNPNSNAPGRRACARGFLDDGRAQVAECAVRFWSRVRGGASRASRRDDARGSVLHRGHWHPA